MNKMPYKFEYRYENLSTSNLTSVLNDLGKDGWEVIKIIGMDSYGTASVLLKRQYTIKVDDKMYQAYTPNGELVNI